MVIGSNERFSVHLRAFWELWLNSSPERAKVVIFQNMSIFETFSTSSNRVLHILPYSSSILLVSPLVMLIPSSSVYLNHFSHYPFSYHFHFVLIYIFILNLSMFVHYTQPTGEGSKRLKEPLFTTSHLSLLVGLQLMNNTVIEITWIAVLFFNICLFVVDIMNTNITLFIQN